MKLTDAIRGAADHLAASGVPDPAHDAAALARHVLDLDGDHELELATPIDAGTAARLEALVDERAARVPLAHLLGRVRVRDIELLVGPGVFVPQPETEAVIDWAVRAIRDVAVGSPVIVDLCTGSGTIAFCLANELPDATVHAVERDPGALAWAERNAALRAAAGDPLVHLHLGQVAGCLPELDGQLDLVASNPPYVATDEAHIPRPEVVDHDPAIALWAGADGLDLVRDIEVAARRLLRPGGLVVVEHSDRQGISAPAVFADAGGWADIVDHVDQDGLDRFVTARWTGTSTPTATEVRPG
ncbi:MAG: peptide chain release factor N(5)-glutamine methyltransferase [Nitriliruptor sp.]|uniref:peptide chain release factor N(5)-glutamine methyltransferase n=1 Tax=Nitriliruptor sp. TaxID=2448056 RepID=UPI0034A078B9